MTNPTYVIVKLDEPVGPDDAQNLAQHIVTSREFADVEWARPSKLAQYPGNGAAVFAFTGEKVSSV